MGKARRSQHPLLQPSQAAMEAKKMIPVQCSEQESSFIDILIFFSVLDLGRPVKELLLFIRESDKSPSVVLKKNHPWNA